MTASPFPSIDLNSLPRPQGAFELREKAAAHEPRGQSGRLNYIDVLRGAAAVQVLLSHVTLAFFPGVFFSSPLSGALLGYLAATPLFFVLDGASAVCIFFTLSGYVLTPLFMNSKASGAVLIFSRFVRLGAPAVAGCILSVVLFLIFAQYNQTAGSLLNSQWLSESWRPASDLWFVKDALVNGLLLGFRGDSIVQWFGLPAAALPEMSNSYLAPLWTLSIEFYGSILVLALSRARSPTLLVMTSIVLSRTYLVCFLAGHVAARFRLGEERQITPWPAAVALATLGVSICMASHFWTPDPVVKLCTLAPQILPPCPTVNPAYLMRIYGAAVFTVAVMQCAPARRFLNHRKLRALGRLSFPLYLTHWPVIFGVGCFLFVVSAPWLGLSSARYLALVASIGLAVIVATAFERVDQMALRASRVLRERKNAGGPP